jgi:hypothetical protein
VNKINLSIISSKIEYIVIIYAQSRIRLWRSGHVGRLLTLIITSSNPHEPARIFSEKHRTILYNFLFDFSGTAAK